MVIVIMEDKLQTRLDFVSLDKSALERIATLAPMVEKHIDDALGIFYGKIATVDTVSAFFHDPAHMDTAKGRQARHWGAIAGGRMDGDYFEASRKVGQVHARIGLRPRWYIGGYALIVERLVTGMLKDYLASREKRGFGFGRPAKDVLPPDAFIAALGELLKAVFLDMDIAVTAYFDKTVEETSALNKRIAEVAQAAEDGDFSKRIDCTSTDTQIKALAGGINNLVGAVDTALADAGQMLQSLADADLSRRMEGAYKGIFADLQRDTNSVADKLIEIVTQLKQTSRGVKTATSEILTGANDLSERTTKQAATIEETSAAMEQLASTVTKNAKRAGTASQQAIQASRTAEEGGEAVREANEAMERISSSSAKISRIIGMIDDIAFQTNLLALNASVEAARAGEAGKGFAVVAIEVRRLAQSAAKASSDVKTLIEQSGEQVSGGTRLVAKAAEKLSLMLDAVRTNATQMEEIAKDSREQASAIEEVNIAIRQMDEMTQHNAALVEQTNAAIEQTEGQASELDRIVELFTLGKTRSSAGANAGRAPDRHVQAAGIAANAYRNR
ncbi:MAG: globin-coupled sensor protein [Alphaproteobacteria bacterium]|nr:globin-coupled sensor protein [Alphaproteobacteria bacterium]